MHETELPTTVARMGDEREAAQVEITQLSFWQGFWLPVTYMLRPTQFGELFREIPRAALAASVAVGTVFLLCAIGFSFWLGEAAAGGSAFHLDTGESPAETAATAGLVLLGIVGGFAFAMLCLSVLRFPDLHRSRSMFRTLARAFASSCSLVWLIACAVLVSSIVVVGVDSLVLRDTEFVVRNLEEDLGFAGIAVLYWSAVLWIRRFDRGISSQTATPVTDFLCEGCGYQLMPNHTNDVCPECGRSVTDSLTAEAIRQATAWEAQHNARGWLATSLACLRRPTATYASMPMREGMRLATSFAGITILAIVLGAVVWFAILMLIETATRSRTQIKWTEIATVSIIPGMAVSMIGWTLLRGVGGIVAIFIAWQGSLRDGRWFAKVLNYESCYLWLYCLFNGVWVSLMVFFSTPFNLFMGRVTGVHSIEGIPWGMVILLFGNAALLVIWLTRYGRTVRAIRWNNF